jgi:hypothetical protein
MRETAENPSAISAVSSDKVGECRADGNVSAPTIAQMSEK